MFLNQHTNAPVAKQQRDVERIIRYRTGAEERKAAAQAKRERRAAKRVKTGKTENETTHP
jgi:hypothetical protein